MSAAVGRPDVDHLIIGGGPAAVACAERPRELDPGGHVDLVANAAKFAPVIEAFRKAETSGAAVSSATTTDRS
jgi:hypothetical protein